ncbi:MAG: exodeoxyribonuclease V subunit alpha [Planctomycetes bacterium]|nr:exodeoxyribonuclease V subunit alpha [Planctomycetota bacterium]
MPELAFNQRAKSADAENKLDRLVDSARENADLLASDLHTIHDWLEIAGYDDETLQALLIVHFLGATEGSLCTKLTRENLTRRFSAVVSEADAADWSRRILLAFEENSYDRLIGTAPDDDRPLILYSGHGERFLYFQKFLRHELDFVGSFRERLARTSAAKAPGNWAVELEKVLQSSTLRLDPDQRAAVELGLTRGLALISGGPGTGKTSIVLTLLRCLVRMGTPVERIALAASTGRAAQRLGDSVRIGLADLGPDVDAREACLASITPSTLHKLLEYHPGFDSCRRHAENPIEADVVIVDEVSMVGMVMMARLLQAVRPDARLILLGDRDQLPSVDVGAVLAHLIPSDVPSLPTRYHIDATTEIAFHDCVALLRTNHRSEPRIRGVAEAINAQDATVVDRIERLELPRDPANRMRWQEANIAGGCLLLEQARRTPAEIREVLRQWAEDCYLSGPYADLIGRCRTSAEESQSEEQRAILCRLFQVLDGSRLLTLVREGPWGCVAANRYIEQQVRARLGGLGRGGLFAGAPVLVTKSDPNRQVYNGDVGLTVRSQSDDLRVIFQRQGGFLTFAPEALPSHELGFALTIHKSQGSEYDRVLVVLPPEGGRRLLTKELVYTAVTRARKLAIVCSTPEVLRLAISRKCAREAGLLQFKS